jgi:SpoIID/LytB domain protein
VLTHKIIVRAFSKILLFILAAPLATYAQTDATWQRAAEDALGRREGAVIVLDAQSGRTLAVVNTGLAFEQKLPPGSTVKPFVALAALRAGLVKGDSRLRCGSPYARNGYQASCVHPRHLPPLDAREALGHSCNFYFGKLGERLTPQQFRAGLSAFGLAENLAVRAWHPRFAIGDSHDIRVRPAQLIAAYAALANGGRLFTIGKAPRLRANVALTGEQRGILLEGMRETVTDGTARAAELKSLPYYIFGKTGTMLNSAGGSQGWFVGLAADGPKTPAPNAVKIAVLVYLKDGKGADSAAIAQPIFAAWQPYEVHHRHAYQQMEARVKAGRATTPRLMPLENYVMGVVNAEASWEGEPEALKATAIAARSYALRHLRRHAREGYDFCSLTHCQRYVAPEVTAIPERIRRAVQATRGQVLTDKSGRVIEAYYSASCGGWTADVNTLWGAKAQSYLRGERDEACDEGPHAHWTDTIAADKLAAALGRDKRTDMGGELRKIALKTDATGRAESIRLSGKQTRTISGWEFKIIVGRALGWNYLKSSRFTVERRGADFIFQGRGFGHGLGLCQEGAHVRARRGASYRQILARYYPGAILSRR